ncbi:helix-turn-helix transcriptional regulator [Clostridium aestuarii]|uniref:Helix-turn-helix transcriptional regulator n=1 Tax=Clostridium aestuarii TaxID=338193 RepID=A0ABT4CUZ3_9CLOT|nr:helix-turn-helix transcriptional regulator [Clostridium aestuarii]MCY6482808.1 helix-turn-helix transcriptional regulator [Clostridium aestuarii]
MQQQLGETIRKYRKQKGYTMTQLADKLNISIGLLSNIETGKTDSFQLTLLNNIIKKLSIPISELELFSKSYPIEELNINNTKDFKKLRSSLEKLIDAFITTFSALSFDEGKIALVTNMLIKELQTINQLIE